MDNIKMVAHRIMAISLMGYTLYNVFTVEVFSGIQSIILCASIVYCVYVYSVYGI